VSYLQEMGSFCSSEHGQLSSEMQQKILSDPALTFLYSRMNPAVMSQLEAEHQLRVGGPSAGTVLRKLLYLPLQCCLPNKISQISIPHYLECFLGFLFFLAFQTSNEFGQILITRRLLTLLSDFRCSSVAILRKMCTLLGRVVVDGSSEPALASLMRRFA
jgi:hypothetical protein